MEKAQTMIDANPQAKSGSQWKRPRLRRLLLKRRHYYQMESSNSQFQSSAGFDDLVPRIVNYLLTAMSMGVCEVKVVSRIPPRFRKHIIEILAPVNCDSDDSGSHGIA
jgi:hypothetical protein